MFYELIAKAIVHIPGVLSSLVSLPEVRCRLERSAQALDWKPRKDKACINEQCRKKIVHDALFCPYCDTVQSEQSGIVHPQPTEPIKMSPRLTRVLSERKPEPETQLLPGVRLRRYLDMQKAGGKV